MCCRLRCRFAQILTLAAVLFSFLPGSAFGQVMPVPRGATVRVLRPNFEGASVWSTGRVVYASRDSLLLAETNSDPLVRFNESLRLQIQKQRSLSGIGGAIGFVAGLAVGWQSSGIWGATADNDNISIATAALGGAIGAAAGALVGKQIHTNRWEDVPLEETRRSVAPLNEPNTKPGFSLGRTVRWAQFEPTVADFEAFFAAHADSLDSVEGIWVRHGTNVGIAIVRVVGTEEEMFAAYTLMQGRGRPRRREDGVRVFALGRTETEQEWYFQVPRTASRRYRADMIDGMLDLFYPTGMVDHWEKLGPY